MFWKKKLKSDEYLELKQQIELIWMEIDVFTVRYKRKVSDKAPIEQTEGKKIEDGFDELRKLNKESGKYI